jgi:hypothetical protein
MIYCTDVYKYDREKSSIEGRFLFPGNSCFPLSPCEEMKKSEDKTVNIVSKRDQLKLILDVLGHQDENSLAFITDDSALEYHKSLASKD